MKHTKGAANLRGVELSTCMSNFYLLKNPAHLEEELGVAVVADGAAYFHWTEDGVHD